MVRKRTSVNQSVRGVAIRAASAMGVAAAIVATTAVAAAADCNPNANGADSGSAYFNVGSAGSSQSSTWNLADRSVYVGTITGSGMQADKCHDMMFDWATNSGHYDSRQIRNCAPGTQTSSQSGTPQGTFPAREPSDWAGRTVSGLQKGAACSYNQPDQNYVDCGQFAARLPGCVFGNGPGASTYPSAFDDARSITDKTKYARYISRSQSGILVYNDGGIISSSTN